MLQNAGICTFWLTNVLGATAAFNFWTSDLQKVVRTCGVLHILTYKCAWRHSGVEFLDIWPSKIGPWLWCFLHFDLQTCFAPQRRAIRKHQNVQKCSSPAVFCTFGLENVLRATAACHFWTSDLQKLVRPCGVLCILTWKCASRHSAVPFLRNCSDRVVFCAFWLENVLRATAPCHFSSVCWTATSAPAALARLLFEHQEPRIIEKTQRFATSLTFGARVASF